MFMDALRDETLIVSNLANARLYVVDPDGTIWVNEVEGCRLRRFDRDGRLLLTLGDGTHGFQQEPTSFEDARFGWIYDIRRGPYGAIFVLDSTNSALRAIDVAARCVRTIAGDGRPGYRGDGGDAREARFGSDASARFDGRSRCRSTRTGTPLSATDTTTSYG